VLIIGEIVGSHGVRGEVKVYPHTDFPQRFYDLETIQIQKGKLTRILNVLEVRQHKNIFIFSLAEIKDRNQSDELRGWQLVVDYQDAHSLPPGHYYDHQLEGLEVWDVQTDSWVGKIIQVLHLPANAVYRVETPAGIRLIPALKQVVKSIDLSQGKMYIKPMEGLLE